jgi:hypothetical protein
VGRRRARTALVSLIIVGLAVAVELSCAPAVPATPTVATYPINPDLQLITTRLPKKPLEVRELRLDPAADAVPDIVPASSHYPLYTLTSTMAAHAGALAAVNSYPSVGGCLVMRPSQPTGERATRSAIDVLGSPDTGAPSTLR